MSSFRKNCKYRIPNFNLIHCCGQGGSSEVWIGADPCGILRAIRIVPKADKTLLESEQRSISLYRRLPHHPNLLDFIYVGETRSCFYYITELADSVRSLSEGYEPDTLAYRIRMRQDSTEKRLQYLFAILEAVQYLHDARRAHNDLKPENIVFVNNVLKLADPGLVSHAESTGKCGTAEYRPGWEATGKEADIYATGKIIYLLFTGKDPNNFPELPEHSSLLKFSTLNRIMLKCCERSAEERYHSVQEIRNDLQKLKKKTLLPRLYNYVQKFFF